MNTEIQLDDETRAALLLFNERLEEVAAEERATKRIAKAERAKDAAAANVRELESAGSSTPEQKAEAEAAYKSAVEELTRIKENPDADPAPAAKAAVAGDVPTAESDGADETEPTETSADEEDSPKAEATSESE